jgi:hypothetical protein
MLIHPSSTQLEADAIKGAVTPKDLLSAFHTFLPQAAMAAYDSFRTLAH